MNTTCDNDYTTLGRIQNFQDPCDFRTNLLAASLQYPEYLHLSPENLFTRATCSIF